MCGTKTEAKAKMDLLIESMDRLAAALMFGNGQPVTVNLFNAPPGTTVTETKDGKGRRIDAMIEDRIASVLAKL